MRGIRRASFPLVPARKEWAMFMLRFDMRAPLDGPAETADLYQAAIEMAEWGESRGCVTALVSEHHTSSDGYIPSPLVLASAIASRTQKLPINVGAVLLNFYDPIKLARGGGTCHNILTRT